MWRRTTWKSFPHSQPTFLHIIMPSWQLTVSMHQIGSLICNKHDNLMVKMTILFLLCRQPVSNVPRTVMLTFQVDLYKTVNRLENGYLVVDLRVKPAKPVGWAHAFTMRSHVTANTILSTLVCMHTVKQINGRVVTMVAWFTVVVEANQSVSLLFPHSGIRIRGEKNKETTPLVVIASVWYQHKPSVVKTTLVEYARVSEFSTVKVLQWPKNLFA